MKYNCYDKIQNKKSDPKIIESFCQVLLSFDSQLNESYSKYIV